MRLVVTLGGVRVGSTVTLKPAVKVSALLPGLGSTSLGASIASLTIVPLIVPSQPAGTLTCRPPTASASVWPAEAVSV